MANQPPSSTSAVASGLFRYPPNTMPPLMSTSPSSAIRTAVPGTGRPTVPGRGASGGVIVAAALVSVRPYPS